MTTISDIKEREQYLIELLSRLERSTDPGVISLRKQWKTELMDSLLNRKVTEDEIREVFGLSPDKPTGFDFSRLVLWVECVKHWKKTFQKTSKIMTQMLFSLLHPDTYQLDQLNGFFEKHPNDARSLVGLQLKKYIKMWKDRETTSQAKRRRIT